MLLTGRQLKGKEVNNSWKSREVKGFSDREGNFLKEMVMALFWGLGFVVQILQKLLILNTASLDKNSYWNKTDIRSWLSCVNKDRVVSVKLTTV